MVHYGPLAIGDDSRNLTSRGRGGLGDSVAWIAIKHLFLAIFPSRAAVSRWLPCLWGVRGGAVSADLPLIESITSRSQHQILEVFTHTSETPWWPWYKCEGETVHDTIGTSSMGGSYIHLEPDIPGEHGGTPGPSVLRSEWGRWHYAVAQISSRQKSMN